MKFDSRSIIFGVILLFSFPFVYLLSSNLELDNSDLVTISGTLSKDPEFKSGVRFSSDYIVLHLDEYDSYVRTNRSSY